MQIVSKSDRSLTLVLVHREESIKSTRSQNLGELTVYAEELSSSKTAVEIVFSCSDLEYKDLFSRSVWTCWILILFPFAIYSLRSVLYGMLLMSWYMFWDILQDPFLVISKIVEGGICIPICKTEVIKNDLKPKWKSVFLNIQQVGSKVEATFLWELERVK